MSKTDKGKQERALRLIECIENGDNENATKLLKDGVDLSVNKMGDCPIHYAARRGKTDMLELLLGFKDNPNRLNQHKNTPIHLATREGHIAAVQYLKGKNANLNAKNEDGDTPLHAAVVMQPMDFLEKIIGFGMKVNEVNKQGQTPLHVAVMQSRHEAMESLLYKKINPSIRDKQGQTAADVAKSPKIETQLRTYAALIAAKDSGYITAQGTSVNPKKVMELKLDRVDVHLTSINSRELLPFQIYCRREKTENSDIKFEKEEAEEVLSDIYILRVTDSIDVVNLEVSVPLYSTVKPREQGVMKMVEKETSNLDGIVEKNGRVYCAVSLELRPNTEETFVFYTKPKVEELIVSGQASVVQSMIEESFKLEVPKNTFSDDTKLTLKVFENNGVSQLKRRKRKVETKPQIGKPKKVAKEIETQTELNPRPMSPPKTPETKPPTPPETKAALLSDLYEINVEGSRQPANKVTVQCPASKAFGEVPEHDVVIVTVDENNMKDESSLQVVQGTPKIVDGSFVFDVSHFSTYVPVLKSVFDENPGDVYRQLVSAKKREQPAVFFVMVLEKVDGDSSASIVVIEVIESRKANTRMEFWQKKGYKPQYEGETDDILTEPNKEFSIEMVGNVIVDGGNNTRKIAFMPRRASSQPFRVTLSDVNEEPEGQVKLVPIVSENQMEPDLGPSTKEITLSFQLPPPPKSILNPNVPATKFDPEKTDLKGPMLEHLKTVFYLYPWIDKNNEPRLRTKIEALLTKYGIVQPPPVMVKNTVAFCKRTFDDWRERVYYALIHNDGEVNVATLGLEELCTYLLAEVLPQGQDRAYVDFATLLRCCAHQMDAFIKSTHGTKRRPGAGLPVTNSAFWRDYAEVLERTGTDPRVRDKLRVVEAERIKRYST